MTGSMWTYITSWFAPTSLFLVFNLVVGTIFIISRFGAERRPQHDNFSSDHPTPLARSSSLLDRVRSINVSGYKFEQHEPQAQIHYMHDPAGPNQLARAPSLLERVKSINFPSFHRPDPIYQEREFDPHTDSDANIIPDGPPPLSRAPSLLERVKSINLSSFYRPDPTSHEPEFTPETDIDDNLIPDRSPYNDNLNHHVSKSKSEIGLSTKPSGQREKMKKSASEKSKMALLDDEQQEDRESIEKRRPATMKIEKTVSFGDEGVDAKADDFINKFKQQLRLQRLDSLLRYKDMFKAK
ncbi:hypothetical protein HS088_TW09G01119 [Tripterygium wilfordii]|uniref:DUF4408 domain-containing protein n=1 Tax=Tripterygium wilfordii TaxID=458696 RepID=A0A7J7D9N0_TRIWF|nr:pathogen-associated molecular patterns-induced protein A70 [Tripterygium wilfordii]KAF5743057.1 hypothetical protein HS088_TW09G01119 [Tripterygium wilfordii]